MRYREKSLEELEELEQKLCDEEEASGYPNYARFKKAVVHHYFQKVIGLGVLDGYSLMYTRKLSDGGRADIVEVGGVVEGKLYEIPATSLEYLYKREGVKSGCYRLTLVDFVVNNERLKNVLTFTVVEKQEETPPPTHYIEEILRGANGFVSEEFYLRLKEKNGK